MTPLLWKVNLPAGRAAAICEHGTYVVQADEEKRRWTIEFTDFPSDTASWRVPPCPTRAFASWEQACLACTQHAAACLAAPPVLLRA